jgi:hypothetical protein
MPAKQWYKKIPLTLRNHLGELTASEFKVWMYLHLRGNKENTAFPSNQTIADELDMNRETVKIAKAGLRKKGWSLRLVQRRRDDGSLSTVVEKTMMPWLGNTATGDGKPSHGLWAENPATDRGCENQPTEGTFHYTDNLKGTPSAKQEPQVPPFTGGSEQETEPVPPSAGAVALLASLEDQNRKGLELVADQKQNQPLTDSVVPPKMVDASRILLETLNPMLSASAVEAQLPTAWRILQHFEEHYGVVYSVWAAQFVLEWNRAHRSGKYASKDDKKMYLRTAEQYLKALDSPSATLLGDYESHEFGHCPTCQEHSLKHVRVCIEEDKQKEQAAADAAARRAEEERLAKLCPICQEREPGKMALSGFMQENLSNIQKVSRCVCDQCYDKAYESRSRGALSPRRGYLESKQKEEQASLRCNGCRLPTQSANGFLSC